VRGLFDRGVIERMRAVIDRALDAQESAYASTPPASENPPWFERSPLTETDRGWVRSTGALLATDSPRGLYAWLDTIYQQRLDELIAGFFGERPALSVEKTTLRRVIPTDERGGWHQDGRFLGGTIRSLNLWVTLSDCGVDAPGLEIIPTRLEHIIPTHGEGSLYFCVDDAEVDKLFPGQRVTPSYAAGDAMFFDHFLLHRTHRLASMTKLRYAIESWFFAPSAYPTEGQTGLFV
jgi:hypothetical protein